MQYDSYSIAYGLHPTIKIMGFRPTICKAVCTMSVAVDESFGDKKNVNFFRVVVWDKLGENCAEWLVKGQALNVEGRLQNREYQAKDGTKRYITEIIARRVEFGAKPQGKKGTNNGGNNNFGEPIPDEDVPF